VFQVQAVQDDGHESAGSPTSGEAERLQQGARILIDSSHGFLSVGCVVSSIVDVLGQSVHVIRLDDVRVSSVCALLILQGMSAISALGPLLYNCQKYLPILADGFCAYKVPVRFTRFVAGIPLEEPIPLSQLVAALAART
jgi:hypothetical protein